MKKTSTKLWKVMKICAVQMMILIVACGISAAHESHAQVLERKVTVSVKDVSLETLIREIEGSARVRIFYSIDQLGVARPVSLQVVDRPLGEVLDEFFSPLQINFKVDEKREVITLKRRRSPPIQEETGMTDPPATRKGALLSVTGIVTDAATQLPMAGVNILVKGTTIGTTTDAEGRYSIEARDNDVLVFSFIGYVTFETVVNARSTIDVIMEVDTKNLDEVVINAGYWKVSDVERTGNISRVEAKEIERQPVSNPMAALIGRMPGVYITENSGVPGAGFNIQIRGRNSLRTDGNNPLYVIDGVPYTSQSLLQSSVYPVSLLNGPSPLSTINPQDIESIEILKDADATAIYGSRGANGVILINTKRGRTGRTTVDVNVTHGVGQVANRVEMLNTEQYVSMRTEAFANDGLTPTPSDYDVNGVWDQTRYTDWQDVLIGGTAGFTNAQVSFSGGSATTRFLIGGGYNRQSTVFPGDLCYQRASTNFNVFHVSANQKFRIDASSNLAFENNNMADITFQSDIYSLPPNAPPLFESDGSLNWENGTWNNPLAQLERQYEANIANLITRVRLSYEVLPRLQLSASMGYNLIQTKEIEINPIKSKKPDDAATGSASFGRSGGNTWILEPQVEYKKQIGRGKVTTLAGMTLQATEHENIYVLTNGVENDALLKSIAFAPSDAIVSRNAFSEYRYIALFSRINYSWSDKYLVNLTARRDGSSRFGPGKRFGNFGAIGAAWIFSNERLIREHLGFLSFGKLRGSYGLTGSDQIGDYGYLDSFGATNTQYQGPGLVPIRIANPDYAWETNRKLEGAIEFGIFQDRLFIATSYYRNRSDNQLVGLPLPRTTGFATVQYNLPAIVQNTGWEFEVRSTNISSDQVTWKTTVNFSLPRNVLVQYPNLESSGYSKTYRVGEPLSIDWTFQYLGVNPETGLYEFSDLDNSGSVTSADNLKVTRNGVILHGGLQNSVRYNGIALDILLQFVNQVKSTYRSSFSSPGQMGNQPVEVMSRWQTSSTNGDVQRFSTTSAAATAYTRWRRSDDAYEDASFVRIKNVSISWEVPRQWKDKLRVQGMRIYAQAQNLFTITKYSGLDPENGFIPPLRTISTGLQMTF